MAPRPAVQEKRRAMFDRYGGMMTMKDVQRELGVTEVVAREWIQAHVEGCPVGKRVKYETDEVAKAIVLTRGMV